ncbi:hypothetical protein [Cerasicoccus frondis]|uniref:hypothetical protein n=1 Tax=Cerasicoccus frondis TaxID=490090 RepID=UPI002852C58E|nr:hypothetical protein [Cerasicoccus frondis]
MGNLSQFMPEETETIRRIFDWHKEQGVAEPPRGYLGASIIGHDCDRYLWYCFRQALKPEFSGRLYRLFETGDLEEIRFVKELRAIGCEVHEVDPKTGEQFEVNAINGHFSGHMDGCASGIPEAPKTWHVLEFKTHNAKSFEKLRKTGVKASKPQHYAQMMSYMGLTGMSRALYLARNKDNDDLYGERIRYNAEEFKGLMARAERIIKANEAPERCASRPDDFRCRFCDAKTLCWGGESEVAVPLPDVSCRTCCHATAELTGAPCRWSCARMKYDIPENVPCDDHLLLPSLIHFADPVDAGEDHIEFKNKSDGAVWQHGPHPGQYSTKALINSLGPLAPGSGEPSNPPVIVAGYEDAYCRWVGSPEGITAAMDELGFGALMEHQPNHTDDSGAMRYFEYGNVLVVVNQEANEATILEGKQ